MQSVVEKGTGANAKVGGFEIAGKTGTAQKASSGGGYQKNAKITSFIGVLPVNSKHRYVVFAAMDEPQSGPQGEAFGGTVAAPIVKDVMDSLILLEKLTPVNGSVPQPSPTEAKAP
jgi:cell division protein FtsI (penicillin-binding protein 3)